MRIEKSFIIFIVKVILRNLPNLINKCIKKIVVFLTYIICTLLYICLYRNQDESITRPILITYIDLYRYYYRIFFRRNTDELFPPRSIINNTLPIFRMDDEYRQDAKLLSLRFIDKWCRQTLIESDPHVLLSSPVGIPINHWRWFNYDPRSHAIITEKLYNDCRSSIDICTCFISGL